MRVRPPLPLSNVCADDADATPPGSLNGDEMPQLLNADDNDTDDVNYNVGKMGKASFQQVLEHANTGEMDSIYTSGMDEQKLCKIIYCVLDIKPGAMVRSMRCNTYVELAMRMAKAFHRVRAQVGEALMDRMWQELVRSGGSDDVVDRVSSARNYQEEWWQEVWMSKKARKELLLLGQTSLPALANVAGTGPAADDCLTEVSFAASAANMMRQAATVHDVAQDEEGNRVIKLMAPVGGPCASAATSVVASPTVSLPATSVVASPPSPSVLGGVVADAAMATDLADTAWKVKKDGTGCKRVLEHDLNLLACGLDQGSSGAAGMAYITCCS